MSTFTTAVRAELARIWSNRMARISLIALMFIPLIYGGMYLWGNKDPYSALDRVPAALVVADSGASIDGHRQNLGREAATEVKKDGTFAWHEVSLAAAQRGVRSGAYDFALVFPSDFSSDLATVSGDAPVKADLRLVTNDTNAYLSTTIAEKTADTVAQSVATKLGRTASLRLLDGVADLRDGLVKAEDGAARLADGASSADAGATQLKDGTASLATGAQGLASGTAQLSNGAQSLSSGLGTLDSSTSGLVGQAQQLASGASAVSGGIAQLHAGIDQSAEALRVAIATSVALTPTQKAQLSAAVQQLDAQSASDSALGSGAAQLAAGAQQLSASAPALRQGIVQAHQGAAQLATGAASAASGAQQLSTGAQDAATGAASLQDGTAQLSSGASELQTSLASGVAKTPDHSAAQRKAIATAIADPLRVKQTAITQAADYGAGLAPFFISLAGWIGIYALFLLLRPLSRRALTAVRRPVATALAGWALPAALGVVQMLALVVVVVGPLGLRVAHPLGLILFLALVTACYAAIVHALNVWLGSVGQFLGLLLMVVQLVTAGGTFPWQTLPGPLAVVHQILPMAHSVDGVRQLMYGISGPVLGQATLVIVLWTLIGLALSIAGAARQSGYRTDRQLRPAAIGG